MPKSITHSTSCIHIITGTHDIQSVIVTGSDHNTIHVRVNYINNTNAQGAFISIVPLLQSDTLNIAPISAVIHFRQNTTVLNRIPFGIYKVMAYDIEEDGLLTMPTAESAVINTVVVLGSLTHDRNSVKEKEVNITTDISHSTLNVNCIYDGKSAADSCMVIVWSNECPDNLNVQVQPRESSSPLLYHVEDEMKYSLIVLTVNQNGILNSTIITREILVGTCIACVHE